MGNNGSTRNLTPLETVIMDCVWQLDEATVHQVREALRAKRPMAYNTVLTMMRILRDKRFLQSRRNGRSDIYHPLVTREAIGRRSLDQVMHRFFAGSARTLVSQLLKTEGLSDEEIKAIRREVNSRLRSDHRRKGERP